MQSRPSVVAVVVALLAVGPCAAQSAEHVAASTRTASDTSTATSPTASTSPAPGPRSPNRLGVWVGGSFASGGPIGNIPQSRVGMIGLRYRHRLVPASPTARSNLTLTYTVDVFPLLFLSIPPNTVSFPPEGGELGGNSESALHKWGLDTYGFGMSPAGLRLTVQVANRVQPFISGSTGLLYFVRSFPNEWGRHLNFMFDVGTGMEVVLTSDLHLSVGYHYHHLSNGFRGRINPGIDAHLLHLGVALSR